jgi:hypothetical protein
VSIPGSIGIAPTYPMRADDKLFLVVHNKPRVEAIRARVNEQLQLIASLKSKIVKGTLDALDIARNQTEDIETFFLADLDRHERTPAQEEYWLSAAERMLQVWPPYLSKTAQRFAQYGDHGIEIVEIGP